MRMMGVLGLALAGALLAPSTARATGKSFDGQVPPEFQGETVQGERFNGLIALKGKVVMLEFFATW